MSSTENPGVESGQSMVARVAAAIVNANTNDVAALARAAIGVMRNADQAMVDAGVAKDEELEWDHSARAVPQVWEAMCDAALVEKG